MFLFQIEDSADRQELDEMVGSASNGVSSARSTLSSQSTDVEVEDEIKEACLIPSPHGMVSVSVGVLPPTLCRSDIEYRNCTKEYPERGSWLAI